MKKLGMTIVLILIIVLASVSVYILSQQRSSSPTSVNTNQELSPTTTNDVPAEWKMIENNQYLFSLRYPEEQYIESISTVGPFRYSIQYCPTKNPADCAFPSNIFQIEVYDNPQNVDLKTWIATSPASAINKRGASPCYFNDSRTVQTTEQFANKEALVYEFVIDEQTVQGVCKGESLEGGGMFKYLFFEKDNKIYLISINSATAEQYPVLNQILSTFTFTQ